jgi:hypothetical protein
MEQQNPYSVPPSEFVDATNRADVLLAGAVSNGSTNTAVTIWPTVTDPTGAFTLTTSAAAGDAYACNRPGIWSIDYFWADAGAAAQAHFIGISLNATAATLNSGPVDFAVANNGLIAVAGVNTAGADLPLVQCSRIVRLQPGDVLRFMSTVALTPDVANTRVFMTRLSG